MKINEIIKLFFKSTQMYSDKHNRRQWILKTLELKRQGKHALQTGGWVVGK